MILFGSAILVKGNMHSQMRSNMHLQMRSMAQSSLGDGVAYACALPEMAPLRNADAVTMSVSRSVTGQIDARVLAGAALQRPVSYTHLTLPTNREV